MRWLVFWAPYRVRKSGGYPPNRELLSLTAPNRICIRVADYVRHRAMIRFITALKPKPSLDIPFTPHVVSSFVPWQPHLSSFAITALVLLGLLWGLYRGILQHLGTDWYTNPDYSHGFLVPCLAAYLVWERRRQLATLPPEPSLWGIGLLSAGLLGLTIGAIGTELYLQRTSLILVIAGLVLLVVGRTFLQVLAFPIAFLFFMVPLPAIVMNAIAFPLQLLAAQIATFSLYSLSIPVLREGNIIMLARTTLEVAEACSGIRSLQALLALGTVYAYFSQSLVWKRWTIVLLSLPIAIAANVFRVTGTGVLAEYLGPEAAQGFYHSLSGWLIFVVAFVLLLCCGAVISRIGKSEGHRRTPSATPIPEQAQVRPSAMKLWPTVIAVAMLLSIWVLLESRPREESVPARKSFSDFPLAIAERWHGKELGLDQKTLDALKLSDYMMRVYLPVTADKDDRAVVREKGPATPAFLYVSYYRSQRTGATYHSPKNCLPGSGWQIVAADRITAQVPGREPITVNKILVEKGLDKELILYWYQDRGRVIASEYWAKAYLIWDAMTSNRTDGALVRLSVPVTATPDQAFRHALGFLQDLWPLLDDHLPAGREAN